MSSRRAAILVLLVLLAASLGLGVPPPALGFSGGIHDTATQRAAELEKTYSFFEAITGTDPYGPQRQAAKAHIFPELLNNGSLLASVALSGAALGYDGLVGDMGTRNHFWTCDEGLHECPEGIVGLDNAWEVAYEEWMNAVVLHRAGMPPPGDGTSRSRPSPRAGHGAARPHQQRPARAYQPRLAGRVGRLRHHSPDVLVD